MDTLRRILFAAFIIGLGLSITLSESALAALTALWLWRLRDSEIRRTQAWPLLEPMLAFAGAKTLSPLLSCEPTPSLTASKALLPMQAST